MGTPSLLNHPLVQIPLGVSLGLTNIPYLFTHSAVRWGSPAQIEPNGMWLFCALGTVIGLWLFGLGIGEVWADGMLQGARDAGPMQRLVRPEIEVRETNRGLTNIPEGTRFNLATTDGHEFTVAAVAPGDRVTGITFDGEPVTGLGTPNTNGDVITREAVEQATGDYVLGIVDAVATVPIPLNGDELTIDGVRFRENMRVLATRQRDSRHNGIWIVRDVGVWSRAEDMAEGAQFTRGFRVAVHQGTAYGQTIWGTGPVRVGVDPMPLQRVEADDPVPNATPEFQNWLQDTGLPTLRGGTVVGPRRLRTVRKKPELEPVTKTVPKIKRGRVVFEKPKVKKKKKRKTKEESLIDALAPLFGRTVTDRAAVQRRHLNEQAVQQRRHLQMTQEADVQRQAQVAGQQMTTEAERMLQQTQEQINHLSDVIRGIND